MKLEDDKKRKTWNDARWHTGAGIQFSHAAESKLVIHQKDVEL